MYFKITCNTPYCGTEMEEYIEAESESEAREIADEMARNNAESYEYLVTGWDDDEYEDKEEEATALEDYYNDCYADVEEISEEEYFEAMV